MVNVPGTDTESGRVEIPEKLRELGESAETGQRTASDKIPVWYNRKTIPNSPLWSEAQTPLNFGVVFLRFDFPFGLEEIQNPEKQGDYR